MCVSFGARRFHGRGGETPKVGAPLSFSSQQLNLDLFAAKASTWREFISPVKPRRCPPSSRTLALRPTHFKSCAFCRGQHASLAASGSLDGVKWPWQEPGRTQHRSLVVLVFVCASEPILVVQCQESSERTTRLAAIVS